MAEPLLQVENLKKHFSLGRGQVLKAVDGVSFSIQPGEVLGLVGESGCGKSTIGKTIVRLHRPTGGQILYRGADVHGLSGPASVGYCSQVQMIFQNPYGTLNPRMTVGEIVGEGIKFHEKPSAAVLQERINTLLHMVGLDKNHYSRFPHEFSGGQRQRIGIARALSVNPDFLVCDEPISALDVSIQAQVVNLLIDLKQKMGLTYLFISHDLNIIKYISDRVVVMYLGNIVEIATVGAEQTDWYHPYSQALISSVPIPDPKMEKQRHKQILQGELPSPINPPDYCKFFDRCPQAVPHCKESAPPLYQVAPNHYAACHLYAESGA